MTPALASPRYCHTSSTVHSSTGVSLKRPSSSVHNDTDCSPRLRTFAARLLPECANLFVTDEHIVPPDSLHHKGQASSLYSCGIHDAVATVRSPCCDNRTAIHFIIDQMVRKQGFHCPGMCSSIRIHSIQINTKYHCASTQWHSARLNMAWRVMSRSRGRLPREIPTAQHRRLNV